MFKPFLKTAIFDYGNFNPGNIFFSWDSVSFVFESIIIPVIFLR